MSDADQVNQALAELWDIVKCRCNEAYTGRGLHDPDCQCDSADAVQTVANAIEALTKERDQWISHAKNAIWADSEELKEAEAYAGELEQELNTCRMAQAVMDNTVAGLEAKLAKAVEFAEIVEKCGHGALWDLSRTTLAEIKGESHE